MSMLPPQVRFGAAILAGVALASIVLSLGSGDGQAAKPVAKKSAESTTGPPPTYDAPQIAYINKYIRQGWKDHELTRSEAATDGEWCRRVYLDILGRIPSVEELDAFVEDYSANKKERLVDRLFDEDHIEEYARNWTTIWTNILIGRNGGNERNSLTNRAGMQQYLRRTFQRNKPYNRMVYEMISAKGTSKPGGDNFNGAVNFLSMKLADNGVLATSLTSEVFLGIRVQCTQCHDHPFNNWKQNAFWEMNAFFRQAVALRRFGGGRNVQFIELDNQDFGGESGDAEDAELFYTLRNQVLQVAYPVFEDIDGTRHELPHSGFIDEVDRRTEFAKFVAKSGYVPRAIVNRMWAHFLGYGFTKPFSDMGPHNPPTHPELLAKLSADFAKEGHDLKKLIRWITLSEAYSLSSRVHKGNKADDPLLGTKPMFSHFYLRQMRAEELYESLLIATAAHKTRGSYEEQEKSKQQWLRQFVIAFGTDENDEATTFDGTIPQTLMLFNGDLIKKATSLEKGSMLSHVATDKKLKGTAKINYLFKAALSRDATKQERMLANKALRGRENIGEALQDIWWVVLNMNEFILNH